MNQFYRRFQSGGLLQHQMDRKKSFRFFFELCALRSWILWALRNWLHQTVFRNSTENKLFRAYFNFGPYIDYIIYYSLYNIVSDGKEFPWILENRLPRYSSIGAKKFAAKFEISSKKRVPGRISKNGLA